MCSCVLCLPVFLTPCLQPSGKGPRLPEVYCVISRLGCFGLFSKVRNALLPGPPVTALIGVSAANLDETAHYRALLVGSQILVFPSLVYCLAGWHFPNSYVDSDCSIAAQPEPWAGL